MSATRTAILLMLGAVVSAQAQKVGTARFPTSCSPAAQQHFDRAVTFLHSFAFVPAVEEFTAARTADSTCAMASWGLALSAWGNPFAAGLKSQAQLDRGNAAIAQARAAHPPTAREQGWIAAAATLYDQSDAIPQPARLLKYRDAMATLAAAQPADTEAAIFHALAQAFSADPADKTYAQQLAAGATLERLFARLPDHPGLAHYIIHAYDIPALAPRAEKAAERYSEIAPGVSHALHMPSHTYTRIGAWQQSIAANNAAGGVAEKEGATAERLHSMDYRVYAYLQLGDTVAAQRVISERAELAARLDPAAIGTGGAPAAGYYAFAAIPARYALERGAWAEAARLEVRPSPFLFADAVTWFARGLGSARTGDTAAARAALTELDRLRAALATNGEGYWALQTDIQRTAVDAWVDLAAGRNDVALQKMQAAAAQEAGTEKNAITPGPLAPARELLGEMLLTLHRPREAQAAFEETLRHEPNRRRALQGAAAAERALRQ